MLASRPFLLATGVAGVLAGLLTLLIWLLPLTYGDPTSLDERFELHQSSVYMLRQWLSFLNVFFVLLSSWGLVVRRLPHSPGAASTGMLFLLFYGAPELLGRSVMVFVREYRWTHELLTETDPEKAAALRSAIQRFDEIWGGLFGLLLICFIVSAGLFGYSLRGGTGLQRAAAWGFALASILGVVTMLAVHVPSPALRGLARWGYPLIQPASRLLLGFWLLSEAKIAGAPEDREQSGASPAAY